MANNYTFINKSDYSLYLSFQKIGNYTSMSMTKRDNESNDDEAIIQCDKTTLKFNQTQCKIDGYSTDKNGNPAANYIYYKRKLPTEATNQYCIGTESGKDLSLYSGNATWWLTVGDDWDGGGTSGGGSGGTTTTTYYATIKYDPGSAGDSATNMPSDQKNEYSSTYAWNVQLRSTIPEWEGHDFAGWLYDGNIYGKGSDFPVEGSTSKNAASSTYTLVAQWTTKTYPYKVTISYDLGDAKGNGGIGKPSSHSAIDDNDSQVDISVSSATPKWEGHLFDGWSCSSLSGLQKPTDELKLTGMATENGREYIFVAQWSVEYFINITHKVKFSDGTYDIYDTGTVRELRDGDSVDISDLELNDDDFSFDYIIDDDSEDTIEEVEINGSDVSITIYYNVAKRKLKLYIYKDGVYSETVLQPSIEVLDKSYNYVSVTLPYVESPDNYMFVKATNSNGKTITTISMDPDKSQTAYLYYELIYYTVTFLHYKTGEANYALSTNPSIACGTTIKVSNYSKENHENLFGYKYDSSYIYDEDTDTEEEIDSISVNGPGIIIYMYYIPNTVQITFEHRRGNKKYGDTTAVSVDYGTKVYGSTSSYHKTDIPGCVYADCDPSEIVATTPQTIVIKYKYEWAEKKESGKKFNLKAQEWKDLQAFVNDQRSSTYRNFTVPVANETVFTYGIYREMVDAIGKGTLVNQFDTVTQALMDELVTNANAMAGL